MEHLDDFTLARIVAMLGGPYYTCELRATCRTLRARIAPPPHCANANELLICGAREDRADLCEMARAAGATDFSAMWREANFHDHFALCNLADSWMLEVRRVMSRARFYDRADLDDQLMRFAQ